MPIYAYKCGSCGFAKDVLQKMSEPPLTVCPACGEASFSKQVTAAGFQLKGSGWYVTDFKGGQKPAGKAEGDHKVDDKKAEGKSEAATGSGDKAAGTGATEGGGSDAKKAESKSDSKPAAAAADKPAKPPSTPPPATSSGRD